MEGKSILTGSCISRSVLLQSNRSLPLGK